MKNKSVELKEDTRILLNEVKGLYLCKNPKVLKTTDNIIIQMALKNYKEVLSK